MFSQQNHFETDLDYTIFVPDLGYMGSVHIVPNMKHIYKSFVFRCARYDSGISAIMKELIKTMYL